MLTDTRRFRSACGKFATGVTVIGSKIGEEIHGMTANGFMSVSLEPLLILVSIGKQAKMHEILMKEDFYSVSVLSKFQEGVSKNFAGSKQEFSEPIWSNYDKYPTIKNSCAFFTADIVDRHKCGDHTLFIGEVNHYEFNENPPILYYGGSYNSISETMDK